MYVCLEGNMKLVVKGIYATLDLGDDDTTKWANDLYLQGWRRGFSHCFSKLVYRYYIVYQRKCEFKNRILVVFLIVSMIIEFESWKFARRVHGLRHVLHVHLEVHMRM